MLQSIRDHLTGWVAIVLFTVIALAFAVWGIDYQFTGDTAAAQVNGEEIPLPEIRTAVRNQLSQFRQVYDELPPGIEEQVRGQVLEGLVRDELLSQHTRKAGYRISDNSLLAAVRSLEAFQDQGRFSSDLFQARLAAQGMPADYFMEQMRRSLRVNQLQQAIAQTAFLTRPELERRTRLERERRRAEWARIDASALETDVAIEDAAIAAYYQENTDAFMRPEMVDLDYIAIDLEALAADDPISETELRSYYEAEVEGGRFVAPAEREARHILIAVDGDTDDAAALASATELLEQLRGGADFATLAAEHSDDPGSAPAGGELGWAQRDAYVGAFADAVFSMEEGELRGPVRTEFGYHVIRLDGIRGGTPKSFESVRDDLRAELARQRAEDEFFELAETLADLAFENPDSLAPVAAELGLEIRQLDGVTRTPGEGLAASPALIDAAFSDRVLDLRENSDLIEPTPEQRVVLRVRDYHPAAAQPLDEVRDQITTLLRARRASELASQRGEQLLARIRAGEPLAAVAAEVGAEYSEPAGHRRTAGLPAELLKALFEAPKPVADQPVVAGVTLGDGDYAVYVLEEVIPGDISTLPPAQTYAAQAGRGELAAYIASLRSGASVIVRPEMLE